MEAPDLLHIAYGLIAISAFVALMLNLMATVSLYRTDQLDKLQKFAQLAIAWLVPFAGSWLVLHLLAESDYEFASRRWIPNDKINHYLLQALRLEAHAVDRAAVDVIEHSVFDSVSGHSHDSGGGGDGGAGHH